MNSDKISINELEKIFKNSYDRSNFIDNYAHFGTDGNDSYYTDFIDANILNRKYKLQENAIELSLAANRFSNKYLDAICRIIYSRRTAWIKLLCLNWLNYFALEIPEKIYNEINLFTKKSDDELLKLQSILNLVQLNPDRKLLEESLEILRITKVPALFYRYLNCINDNHMLTFLPIGIIKQLDELIRTKEIFREGQKADLELKLSAYITAD